jgi:hypothetical protein
MKRLIYGALTAISALLMAAVPLAASAQTTHNNSDATIYSVTPWTFVGAAGDCGTDSPAGSATFGSGANVVSRWTKDTSLSGNPGPVLYLQKFAPTTDCSSAGATINGVDGLTNLTELNFDYYSANTSEHCGAGAPRFNVVTTDGTTHFLGCSAGTTSPAADGWTHVVFDPTNATSTQAYPAITSDEIVSSIDIVFDEQGFVHLDNISVNNTVIDSGGTPWSKDVCKKNGYKNFVDLNGSPFKNQGQCVSFVARNQHGMVLGASSNKDGALTNQGVTNTQ